MITRYREQPGGAQVFEVIQPFRPFAYQTPPPLRRADREEPALQEGPLRRWAEDKMIALSLRLETFETARREDRHHTLLMAAILIVLGTGALYFIFVVQNYSLVDRTLDRMKSYTENVVESMADGLISLDREGRIVTLNRQAAEILGSGRERLEGRNITDLSWAKGSAGFWAPRRGGRWCGTGRWRSVGTGRQDSPQPQRGAAQGRAGQEMGSVLLIKDLRQIRDLQEKVRRSERLASLGRLAAGVAHEIRNPLSSIRGFAQYFLKRFSGQPEEEGYASVMIREVDRLNRVITELLDFAGPKEPHREPHSLEAIAEHALKLLAPDLEARKVAVVREYEPGLPPVPVDRDQISQVFINILLERPRVHGGGRARSASAFAGAVLLRRSRSLLPIRGPGFRPTTWRRCSSPSSAGSGREPAWGWRSSTRSSTATGERSAWRASRERERRSGYSCPDGNESGSLRRDG